MGRFKNINELKAGSILTYVNLIISTIIPLLYTPIMLDKLGTAEYGLFGIANSVIGYLTLLHFGLGTAVNRYVTKYRVENEKDKLKKIVGLFLIVYAVLAALVLVLGIVVGINSGFFFGASLYPAEVEKLKILILIMTVSTAISFPVSVFSAIIVSYEKYIFRKIMDMMITVLTPILNLVVLYMGMASVGMACISLIIQVFYAIILVMYCSKKLSVTPEFKNPPMHMLKEIFSFSLFVMVSIIADMLYWATDKVLIGAMIGTTAVAVYNMGGTFVSMFQNMASAISGVFGTRINAYVFQNKSMDEISELLIRIGRIQYYIVSLILSGYIVFGQDFIRLWVGDEFSMAYYIGLLTMIPLGIPLIQSIAYNTIVAQNKHKFRSLVYCGIAVINVVGTYLLIPSYGIMGAAGCTAVAFLLGNGLILNIYYYKNIGLNIPKFWLNILKNSIVPVVMGVIGTWIFTNAVEIRRFLDLFIYAIIYTGIFGILSWIISMNRYEKDLLLSLIKVVKRKG